MRRLPNSQGVGVPDIYSMVTMMRTNGIKSPIHGVRKSKTIVDPIYADLEERCNTLYGDTKTIA
jgi:hypothetical protein